MMNVGTASVAYTIETEAIYLADRASACTLSGEDTQYGTARASFEFLHF